MDITHKTNIKRFLNVERTRQTDYGTQDLRNYVIVNFVSFFFLHILGNLRNWQLRNANRHG